MDSTQVKAAVIKQVQQEANLVNARTLIEVRPFHNCSSDTIERLTTVSR
jgi:hypothetical protein